MHFIQRFLTTGLLTVSLVLQAGLGAHAADPELPPAFGPIIGPVPPVTTPGPELRVPEPEPAPAARHEARIATVPAHTVINVRLKEALHSKKNEQGDIVEGIIPEALYIGPHLALPAGSTVTGRITDILAEHRDGGPHPYIVVDFHEIRRPEEMAVIPFQGTLIAYKTGLTKKDYVWRMPQKSDTLRNHLTSVAEGAAYGFMADPVLGPPIGAGAALLKSFLVGKVAERTAVKIKPETEVPVAVQEAFRLPLMSETAQGIAPQPTGTEL